MLQLATQADNCQYIHLQIKLLKPSSTKLIRPPRLHIILLIICLFKSKNPMYRGARSAPDVDSTRL